MMYTVVQRQDPTDRSAPAKFFPAPIWTGEVTLRQLAERISKSCTLTPSDIAAVLESFLAEVPDVLLNGQSVRLGDFGILRLTFKASGSDTQEEVGRANIQNVRVVFRSGVELKRQLQKAEFRRVKK